jgi:hypothetical protein
MPFVGLWSRQSVLIHMEALSEALAVLPSASTPVAVAVLVALDCTSLALIEKDRIKQIMSFDCDFDGLVLRVC